MLSIMTSSARDILSSTASSFFYCERAVWLNCFLGGLRGGKLDLFWLSVFWSCLKIWSCSKSMFSMSSNLPLLPGILALDYRSFWLSYLPLSLLVPRSEAASDLINSNFCAKIVFDWFSSYLIDLIEGEAAQIRTLSSCGKATSTSSSRLDRPLCSVRMMESEGLSSRSWQDLAYDVDVWSCSSA